ncbi:hypothetical protein QFC21_005779 [Naganishia friedmannii]|uniref:Uncharacterized protein n=1 Tax=Naganishia friedmannii TaxID=89922 RepID=A0ACC2V7D4_9TREE|nr:hypothetical protein QFC21_005779 [Naganishia friedmannii]
MDARALLRAKKAGTAGPASSKGTSPYLKIDAKGDKRCSICGVLAKHWEAHQVSKQHKTSLQRIRQEEAAAAAAAKKKEGKKRQAVDDVPMEGPIVEGEKVVVQEEETGDRNTKRLRTKNDAEAGRGQQSGMTTTLDAELDSFLSSLSSIPAAEPESAPITTTTSKSKYKPSQPETQTFYESAPIKNALPATTKGSSTISSNATAASNPFAGRLQERTAVGPEKPSDEAVEEEEEEEEEEETPAQKRAREQREEREEIMSRLEEEQRAQEEADERVQSLKARMELIKKQRAAAKASKA